MGEKMFGASMYEQNCLAPNYFGTNIILAPRLHSFLYPVRFRVRRSVGRRGEALAPRPPKPPPYAVRARAVAAHGGGVRGEREPRPTLTFWALSLPFWPFSLPFWPLSSAVLTDRKKAVSSGWGTNPWPEVG